jgi:uncharacterized protein with PIN domain
MGKDAATIRDELRVRLGQIARELGREVYPDGLTRDIKFSELETVAGTLGDEIARQLIETQVRGQAEDWSAEELSECPECGGPGSRSPDEPRVLTTTQGDIHWKQRTGYCARCRRAFFPSEPSVGH